MLNNDNADRRLSSNLIKWAARPRRLVNIAALAMTAAMMMWLVVFACKSHDPAAMLKDTAFVVFALYASQHVFFLFMLRLFRDRGVPEAALALEAYRDPRRISHLDVAMLWVGLAATSPVFGAFAPAG